MKKIAAAASGYFRATDKWLLLFWLGASALSILFLWGLYHQDISPDADLPGPLRMQIIASCAGAAAALVISLIDYRFLLKLWKLYVPVCLVLMLLTFFSGMSSVRGDNQAWLLIPIGEGDLSIQPSEFLKLSFITTMSIHIAKLKDHLNELRNVLLLCVHGGAHILLVQLQGDSGTALIFILIFIAMIFCAGLGWRYIAAAAAALVAAVPVLWFYIMSDDQKMRILVLRNPELNADYAYQQMWGINALGYGGIQGVGIFSDQHIRVPEAYNDFILSFIGQSAGFIGCLGVIALLCAIAFKILYNSRLAADDEGRFICIGVFAMAMAQSIINIGMCLRLLPVIGVTLPLFSAGGSSILSMYVGLGLVLSVYYHRNSALFYD